MIWILIFLIALLLGIIFYVLIRKTDFEFDLMAFIFLTIGSTGLICTLIPAVICQVHPQDQFEKDIMYYEVLQEQVDTGDYKSTTLTKDIVEYNQKVFDAKKYHNSMWTGIFHYNGEENLPYVNVDKEKENDT